MLEEQLCNIEKKHSLTRYLAPIDKSDRVNIMMFNPDEEIYFNNECIPEENAEDENEKEVHSRSTAFSKGSCSNFSRKIVADEVEFHRA